MLFYLKTLIHTYKSMISYYEIVLNEWFRIKRLHYTYDSARHALDYFLPNKQKKKKKNIFLNYCVWVHFVVVGNKRKRIGLEL